ncbi:CHAT domain-containing tetratricopeptide repeat protein, partial [Methanosarcina sp. 1.H.T.1A.1]|uniref:CHAT domain-containing protein n=1 Tax=Methanosarcina sp. 1.H.T.1A.1 TaxID=1483602 RepID=UPI00064F0AAD
GDLKELEEAIEKYKQAVSLTPPESPELPGRLNNLGVGLKNRYSRTSDFKDLEEAIEKYKQAVSLTPSESPELPGRLNNLGNGLRNRYSHTGDLKDIEEAIEKYKQAVSLTPPESPEMPSILNNLGTGLRDRYSRTWDLKELEEAIEKYKQAVSLTLPESPKLPMYLNNLGAGLSNLYSRTWDLKELEEAIENFKKAVSLTPQESPELPGYLNNLGAGLSDLYSCTGDQELEGAIENFKKAVSLTFPESPELPMYLNNLGNGLSYLYFHTGDLKNLEEAIANYKMAFSLTDPEAPSLPGYLNNLGSGLSNLYSHTGDLKDIKEAFGAYNEARNCMDHSFSKIMVAYKLGLRDTLGKIDVNIVKISLKLKEACSPAEISKWVIESMVSVEGAKSRLLNEFIAKGDIPAPSSISPALAEEEAQIVKKLVDIDNMELSSRGLLGASEEETSSRMLRIKERDEFIQRLNNLWSQMETFGEEAANFVNLRRGTRPSWEDLRILTKEAGSDSAVLSLFILDEQLILFVLKEDWEYPEIIEASLTYNILQKKEGKSFSEVMEDLKIIVGPLLESIRPYLNGVKRVIISPYGFGHFIPWAALAKESNLEVSWVVVPALGSLSGILKRSTKGVDRSLVIGNPIEDLDHSEEEAKIIADRLNSKPVLRKRATKEIAMDLLPEVRIAHFSTHGYFAPSDPLDSGIVLANGVLTAREVMGLGARPELLVLSACETGVTGNMGGDEMMGLSQAFLQAGARSLLVSLWKVDDESTAFLMENFYDFWLKGDNKAEALSKAMDETRKLWSDIYYWGAFNLVGDWR